MAQFSSGSRPANGHSRQCLDMRKPLIVSIPIRGFSRLVGVAAIPGVRSRGVYGHLSAYTPLQITPVPAPLRVRPVLPGPEQGQQVQQVPR